VSETSQKRALKNYRRRLGKRGMARFEVLGLASDRLLIRSLANLMHQSAWIKPGLVQTPGDDVRFDKLLIPQAEAA